MVIDSRGEFGASQVCREPSKGDRILIEKQIATECILAIVSELVDLPLLEPFEGLLCTDVDLEYLHRIRVIKFSMEIYALLRQSPCGQGFI